MRPNSWKQLKSRIAYENAWLRLREDVVLRPDGAEGIYGVVELRPSVGVVALDGTNGLLIVIFAKKTLVFRVLVYILRDERASHDYFQLAVASIVESGRCQLAA